MLGIGLGLGQRRRGDGWLPIGLRTLPAGFNNPLSVQVYSDGRSYSHPSTPYELIDFTLAESYTEYWVDYTTGSDSNDGLSEGNAFKTFDKFISVQAASGANSVVHCKDAIIGYLSKGGTSGAVFDGKVKIIGEGSSGRTIFAAMRENYDAAFFNFTASGSNGTFVSKTLTSGDFYRSQFDGNYRDSDGIPTPITVTSGSGAPSGGEVPVGTAYWDSAANKVYVHMMDGRAPDPADGWLYSRSAYRTEFQQAQTTDAGVILIENIEFLSNTGVAGTAVFRYRPVTTGAENTVRLGLKNCLAYGGSGNAFEIYDACITVLENCRGAYCRSDIYNYHSFVTTGTKGEFITVYEYGCKGYEAGYTGFADQPALGTSANATTAHDSMQILRVNESFRDSNGAVLADVNGVMSVGFGISAIRPKGTAAPKACFWHDKYLAVGSTPIMYLEGCSANDGGDGSVSLLNNIAQGGGAIGDIRVGYWRGQIADAVIVGQIKDWAGNNANLADLVDA